MGGRHRVCRMRWRNLCRTLIVHWRCSRSCGRTCGSEGCHSTTWETFRKQPHSSGERNCSCAVTLQTYVTATLPAALMQTLGILHPCCKLIRLSMFVAAALGRQFSDMLCGSVCCCFQQRCCESRSVPSPKTQLQAHATGGFPGWLLVLWLVLQG